LRHRAPHARLAAAAPGRAGFFIAGNLALGITFSTVSANQMQAMQFAP
jgi:hypothetical protein